MVNSLVPPGSFTVHTLTVRKFSRLAVQRSVWTEPKYSCLNSSLLSSSSKTIIDWLQLESSFSNLLIIRTKTHFVPLGDSKNQDSTFQFEREGKGKEILGAQATLKVIRRLFVFKDRPLYRESWCFPGFHLARHERGPKKREITTSFLYSWQGLQMVKYKSTSF